MEDDAARWDARYRDSNVAEPHPPDVLASHPELLEQLPAPGSALDLACGAGAQTLWLSSLGHRVTGLDVSPIAVDTARRAVHRLDDADQQRRIEFRVVDLDDGLPIELGPFDVVVCQRFRDPRLYGAIVDALRPGGVAIVTVLSAVGLGDEPGPFHAAPGELSEAFRRSDTDVLLDLEADGSASIVLRRR